MYSRKCTQWAEYRPLLQLSQVQSTRWAVAVLVYYSSTCIVTSWGVLKLAGCTGTIASCASTSVAAILIYTCTCSSICGVCNCGMYVHVHVSCDADLSTICHLKWSCDLVSQTHPLLLMCMTQTTYQVKSTLSALITPAVLAGSIHMHST